MKDIATAILLVLSFLFVPTGCGNHSASAPAPELPVFNLALPPLPVDRDATAVTDQTVEGNKSYNSSLGATKVDTDMSLESTSTRPAWGIWSFKPAEGKPLGVDVELSVTVGNAAYVAIADYAAGTWIIDGPLTETKSYDLDAGSNLSGGGRCYVAVICAEGQSALVDKLVFHEDKQVWHVITVDSDGWTGFTPSLAVIDGQPAIAYRRYNGDHSISTLTYVRSSTIYGSDASDWGTPVEIVETAPAFGPENNCSLADIAGYPYVTVCSGKWCVLLRSDTQTGESEADWNLVTIFNDDNDTAQIIRTSLAEVNGLPAVCAVDQDSGYLFYHYNPWSPGIGENLKLDLVGVDDCPNQLAVVDGYPAIAYGPRFYGSLAYIRATNETGADFGTWSSIEVLNNEPVTVDSLSLATVLGRPAVAYATDVDPALVFYRSTNSSGTGDGAWDYLSQVIVDSTINKEAVCSLAVIGGYPAIAYNNWYDDNNLYFKRALTEDGEGAGGWESGPGEIVDVESARTVCMAEVAGSPAIAYHSQATDDLKYAILSE